MPPKPKYTKDEIAKAALDIIKEEGVNSLTARNLGKKLGSSSRPIFTAFKSMDDVKWAARQLAMCEFENFLSDFTEYTPAFKRIGMLMVSYAINEPELFKLLFMQEHIKGQSFKSAIQDLGDTAKVCIELIQRDYGMTPKESKILFEHMWVHTFGMGALCAMKVCSFTEEEVTLKLGQVFSGMVMIIKSDKLNVGITQPEKTRSDNDGVLQ